MPVVKFVFDLEADYAIEGEGHLRKRYRDWLRTSGLREYCERRGATEILWLCGYGRFIPAIPMTPERRKYEQRQDLLWGRDLPDIAPINCRCVTT